MLDCERVGTPCRRAIASCLLCRLYGEGDLSIGCSHNHRLLLMLSRQAESSRILPLSIRLSLSRIPASSRASERNSRLPVLGQTGCAIRLSATAALDP